MLNEFAPEICSDLSFAGAGLQHPHERPCQTLILICGNVWANTDRIPLAQECIQFGIALSRFLFTKHGGALN